jgi:hypothetical protein
VINTDSRLSLGQVSFSFFRNDPHEQQGPISIKNQRRKRTYQKSVFKGKIVPNFRVFNIGSDSSKQEEEDSTGIQEEDHNGENDVPNGLPFVETCAYGVVAVEFEEADKRNDELETGDDEEGQGGDDDVELEQKEKREEDHPAGEDEECRVRKDVEFFGFDSTTKAGVHIQNFLMRKIRVF